MVSVFDQTELRLPKPNYEYVTNEDDARKAMSFLANCPIHSIDTETTGLDPHESKISLIQIGANDKVFVFDVRHETEHSSLHKDVLKPILMSNNYTRILQNALFDMKMIYYHMGFYLPNIYDTMLVEQLLNLGLPGVKANLHALLLKYLGITMQKEPRLTFQNYNQKFKNFQLEYAANDTVALETIKDLQWSKVQQEGLENVCRLEFEFLIPMAEMEGNGILLDTNRWSSIMTEVEKEMVETGNVVKSILDENQDQSTLFGVSTINIDSNLQLKKALNRYGLNLDNTSVDELEKHRGIPVIDALLDYRKTQKLISTYSDSLIERINPHTGRLHTDFRQLVATGRMSSSHPNLQNIPKKQKFRSCFVAKDGYSLITSDMASCELRILGNLSEDPVFLDCFKHNIDLHTRTASEIFDVHIDKVTHDMRGAAKAINFGLCVQEDTKLVTNKGIKKIKDVNVGQKISHDLGVNEIIDKKFMGEKEVFEIKTKYGYTLEVTSDHLIKVINEDGNYVDKKLLDINIDKDYVCIKSGSNLFPKNNYKFDKFSVKRNTTYKHFELPKVLNEDWAIFLGLYVSEGHLRKSKHSNYNSIQFGISSKEKDFVAVFDNLLKKLFDKFGRYIGEKIITYNIGSVLIANWIKSLFTCDFKNKTDTIEVPKCIKCSPKNIQAVFIRALFEGDGAICPYVSHYRISYSSKSINLMNDLQVMLLNFGILSTLYYKFDKRYPNEDYYVLGIISKYNDLFMKDIGFLTNHKNNKQIDNRSYIRSCFILPYQKQLLLKVRSKLQSIRHRTSKDCNNIRYLYNSANLTSVKGLGDFYLDQFAEYDKFFKFIYDNNIISLPIKSIKSKGIKRIYDISVENHQYFLANGFIVHNCYGMSSVGLAKRLKISKKKAKGMIDKYFRRYGGIERYLEKAGKDAILDRHTVTISGRKRYYNLPEYDHPDRKKIQGSIERKGKNAGIQGSLAAGTNIKGLGCIGKYLDKKVELETGFGKNSAVGVYSGKKDIYELKLSNGAKLNITLEHQIPVCTDNGMVDKCVKDIVLNNDMLIIPLNIENGKKTDLSGYEYVKKHWRVTYKKYQYPDKMNSKLAFVIGCLIGDGSYSKHNNFSFVCPNTQKELLDKFNIYVYDLFKYKSRMIYIHKNDPIRKPLPKTCIYSVAIRGFLKHIGLECVTHKDKVIPEYFFTETIKNKGALLNGLFSTDGGLTKKSGSNFTTTSKRLANGIHQLLFSFGINSNLKIYKNNYSSVYRIQIPKRFNRKFKKYIGFSINKKTDLLNTCLTPPKFGDDSLIPDFIPKTIEKVFRCNLEIYNELSYNDKAHLRRFKLGKCSYTSWRKFYNLMPDGEEKNYLSQFLSYDFCTAASLKYIGKEKTYDLVCEKNPKYFIANGVIVHNSNADVIKESMILLVDKLVKDGYDAKLLLTVHDEVVVEVKNDQKYEVGKVVSQSLIDGFGRYFSLIPMEADSLIGHCWLKNSCENKVNEVECGNTEMKFIDGGKYGTKLICNKCGADQE